MVIIAFYSRYRADQAIKSLFLYYTQLTIDKNKLRQKFYLILFYLKSIII